MSQPVDHDMTAVLEAIDHYSDGDVDQPQEIMVELQEGCSNKHKRLNKKVYEKGLFQQAQTAEQKGLRKRARRNSRRNW